LLLLKLLVQEASFSYKLIPIILVQRSRWHYQKLSKS
jgi:hypothetical protein